MEDGSDSELDVDELIRARTSTPKAVVTEEEEEDVLAFSIYNTPSKPAPAARLSPQPRSRLPTSSVKKLVFKPVSTLERKLKTCTQYVCGDFILNPDNGRVRPMVRVVDLSLFSEAMQDYIQDRRQSSSKSRGLFVEITKERVEMDEVCAVELEHQIPFDAPRSKHVERLLAKEQGDLYGAMKEANAMYQAALARQREKEADELEVAQLRHVLVWSEEEDDEEVVVEHARAEIIPFTFRVGKELAIQPRLRRDWERTKVLQVTRGEDGEHRVQMDNGRWLHDTDCIKTKRNSVAFRFEQFVQAGSRFRVGSGGDSLLDAEIKRARLAFNQQARDSFPEFAHLMQ